MESREYRFLMPGTTGFRSAACSAWAWPVATARCRKAPLWRSSWPTPA